jgi:hypothetical protein
MEPINEITQTYIREATIRFGEKYYDQTQGLNLHDESLEVEDLQNFLDWCSDGLDLPAIELFDFNQAHRQLPRHMTITPFDLEECFRQSDKEKQGYIGFHDCPIGWNATFGAFEFFIFGDEPSDQGIAHRIFYDCDDGATDWEISSRDFSASFADDYGIEDEYLTVATYFYDDLQEHAFSSDRTHLNYQKR